MMLTFGMLKISYILFELTQNAIKMLPCTNKYLPLTPSAEEQITFF